MTVTPPRARDLGLAFDGVVGPLNAITDVVGVEVGHVTLISGDGPLVVGEGPVRTGVTAILPRGRTGLGVPCAAGTFSLNGNGELTGRTWIDESGQFQTPILLTNSHSVGACHTGMDQWLHRVAPQVANRWMLPVVGETWDGYLNDINGGHVTPETAQQALDAATPGPVAEGNVGGGTGMNCYEFKGGVGTSSRVVEIRAHRYTVGVCLQANFGARDELLLAGQPLGRLSAAPHPISTVPWLDDDDIRITPGAGSVIGIVATDAPLLPQQCAALARRVPLGLARTGTSGSHFSGDIFLAFSTANRGTLRSDMGAARQEPLDHLEFLPWGDIDPLYRATVCAAEEAVANVLVAAKDMTGRDGHTSYALPHAEIIGATDDHRRSGCAVDPECRDRGSGCPGHE